MKTPHPAAILLTASLVAAATLAPPGAADPLDCEDAVAHVQRALETADPGAGARSDGGLAGTILDAVDACGDGGGSDRYAAVGEPAGGATSTASPIAAGVAGAATPCGGGGARGYVVVTTTFAFRDGHSAVTEHGTAFIEKTAEGLWRMSAEGGAFGFEAWSDGRGSITIEGQSVPATAGSVTPFCLSPGDRACGGDGLARHDGAFTITVQADFNDCLAG